MQPFSFSPLLSEQDFTRSLRFRSALAFIVITAFFFVCLNACTDPNSTTLVDDDLKVSVDKLDFDDNEMEKTFTITAPTPPVGGKGKLLEWTISKRAPWLNVDVESGNGTRIVKVSLNRSMLGQGIQRDTLKILGRPGVTSAYSTVTKSIPVSASGSGATAAKNAMTQIYQQLIANGVQLPPGLDSAASLTASVRILPPASSVPVLSAFGGFYQNKQFLVNAGKVSLRAGSVMVPRTGTIDSLALAGASFSYTNPISGTASTGVYYLATATLPDLMKFDGTTQHVFNIYGNGSFPAYKDSVLSVVSPVISTPASGTSAVRTSNLAITWSPSPDGGDSVYAAIVSSADPTKVGTTLPVSDAAATLSISSSLLSRLPAGSASIVLVRYRTTIRVPQGSEKRIIMTLAQIASSVSLQ